MPRRKRSTQAWVDAESHPVAWFNALIRGLERGDTTLIEQARAKLKQLGFTSAINASYKPAGQGVDQ